MKKKIVLLLLIVLFSALLVAAPLLYNHLKDNAPVQSMTESELEKYRAPDFTVYDISGNAVQLSDFFGKPIVLNFWASWCGPCQGEMPYFDTAAAAYQDEVVFLMVNMTDGSRETIDTAAAFIENRGYDFPVYYDTKQNAAEIYGVYSLPTSYFIDANGTLVTYAKGAITYEMLLEGIGMIQTNGGN